MARKKLSAEERREKRDKRWFKRIEKILALRKAGSASYDAADELLNRLLKKRPKLRAGRLVPYKDGHQARIKDNFAETNKVYRAHGISRFEIEVVDANGKVIRNPD
jgi:hypothetical protein